MFLHDLCMLLTCQCAGTGATACSRFLLSLDGDPHLTCAKCVDTFVT